ncbi:MAG: DUF1638 domain-containing protein [Eubacteriaceae bacterium]|jgi:hypothetical protein
MKEVVLSCGSLKTVLDPILKERKPEAQVIYLDTALHAEPRRIHQELQKLIDTAGADRIYIVYGACGGSLAGLNAGSSELVFLKVPDCIGMLFPGDSPEKRKGIYFVTPGLARSEHGPLEEIQSVIRQRGEEQARRVFARIYQDYHAVCAVGPDPAASEKAQQLADFLKIPCLHSGISTQLLEQLFDPGNFSCKAVVKAGNTVPFSLIYNI